MASSSSGGGECIHISLGSTANAVTAHLLNLEGLAATSGNCNPNVTHTVQKQTRVPRVLLVDEPQRFRRTTTATTTTTTILAQSDDAATAAVSTWDGRVTIQQPEPQQQQPYPSNNNNEWLQQLHMAAHSLVQSPFSRYHVESPNLPTYSASDNGRHVVWDDNEDEEEEEEEEDEETRLSRQERQRRQWLDAKQPMDEEMRDTWRRNVRETHSQNINKETNENETNQEQQGLEPLSWMDFWMPPYPTNYAVPLSFHRSGIVDNWDNFLTGSRSQQQQREWYEDDMLESVRHVLEGCDAVEGVTIATEGHGVYAGLATCLLQEFQEECRAAGRFVWHVTDPKEDDNNNNNNNKSDSPLSWHPLHVQRVRRHMENGLALHGLATHSHVVLPLSIASAGNDNVFANTSRLAAAIEATTLAHRGGASNTTAQRIGLIGYYGGSGEARAGYGTVRSLSFGEMLASVQPSQRYKFVELDCCWDQQHTPWIQSGTSIERQLRMQRGGRDARRGRDELPGAWLDADRYLRPLSPQAQPEINQSRSLHHQFALSSAMRSSNNNNQVVSDPLTCLMESMAVRYRPEVAMGLVTDESLSVLTTGGYGAGSYWDMLFPDSPSIVSVLGNSSRSYHYLHEVASGLKESLSAKFRGYHNRDVLSGVLPEAEDCLEAKEYCFDVREVYHPPDGSGLGVDEEGTYFDSG